MFARHRQQLVLRAIAQFALPESRRPLREFGSMSRCISILLHNIGIRFTARNPVIKLRRRFSYPARLVRPQFHSSDGWIIPEEAITPVRDQERNRYFRVALH